LLQTNELETYDSRTGRPLRSKVGVAANGDGMTEGDEDKQR